MKIGFLLFYAASVSCKFNKFYQTSSLFYILAYFGFTSLCLNTVFFKVHGLNGGFPNFLFRCSG